MAVSPSGELLASGQIGTNRFKGNAAPVFLWSTETGRRLAALRGLDFSPLSLPLLLLLLPHSQKKLSIGITQKVNLLHFSSDEKFICGCGEVCSFRSLYRCVPDIEISLSLSL